MRPGEIYLAWFPFGDAPDRKLRPVLMLTGTIGRIPEVLVAYISSVLPERPLPSDLLLDPALPEFRGTHLKKTSILRLHKLATIHGSSIERYMGALNEGQQAVVVDKLRALLRL
jgi:mRNA interferase MazF